MLPCDMLMNLSPGEKILNAALYYPFYPLYKIIITQFSVLGFGTLWLFLLNTTLIVILQSAIFNRIKLRKKQFAFPYDTFILVKNRITKRVWTIYIYLLLFCAVIIKIIISKIASCALVWRI